jgi:hypothetical protein
MFSSLEVADNRSVGRRIPGINRSHLTGVLGHALMGAVEESSANECNEN